MTWEKQKKVVFLDTPSLHKENTKWTWRNIKELKENNMCIMSIEFVLWFVPSSYSNYI